MSSPSLSIPHRSASSSSGVPLCAKADVGALEVQLGAPAAIRKLSTTISDTHLGAHLIAARLGTVGNPYVALVSGDLLEQTLWRSCFAQEAQCREPQELVS